jgi:hypothetical protein
MKKLSAIVSDFDDTIFFNKKALIHAAKDLYDNLIKSKDPSQDYKLLSDLEITMEEGKVAKGFNKKWKTDLYTLAYVKYCEELYPNEPLINYLNECVKQGSELIILSARGEEFRKETEELLNAYNLNYKLVILPKNHELKDEEWKLLEIKKLSDKYNHLSLFEDKEENIRYILNNLDINNIECYLVNHSFITKM